MTTQRTPTKSMVATRSKQGDTVDPDMEKLRTDLEQATIEIATARSENEQLRNQLDKLMQLNESLLAEREERPRPEINAQQGNTSTIPPVIEQNSVQSDIDTRTASELNNVNAELVRGILSHFQGMQINTPMPTYNGERGNAAEFLEKFEKYLIKKGVTNNQKLTIIEDALQGRARAWLEARTSPFIDFNHFKSSFLKEFFSIEARAELKSAWTLRKFKTSDGTLLEYFMNQRRAAKFFNPPLDEYEVNYYIINQLPQRVRDILAVIDYVDSERISQALGRLDSTHKESTENL